MEFAKSVFQTLGLAALLSAVLPAHAWSGFADGLARSRRLEPVKTRRQELPSN